MKNLWYLWKEYVKTQASVQRTDAKRQTEVVVVDGYRLGDRRKSPPKRSLDGAPSRVK
jgi:hypothetical protein